MEHSVLVVDNSYKPIKIIGWEDAIVDILNNRFSVLDYSDKYVNSAHDKWYLPEIIVSPRSMKIGRKVKFDYDAINPRDNYVCAYCGEKFSARYMSVDHIMPQTRGGIDSWTNCISACKSCNNRKAGRTPEEAGMKLLYPPIEPKTTLELALYRMRLKDEWLPYMPMVVLQNINALKERTDNAQKETNSRFR
jgi:hypothetical protein